jgi:predicted XRE-type DNA-binding protein
MKRRTRTNRNTNVFRDLGFNRHEAENLRVRSDLMIELVERIEGMRQIEAAKLLGVSQPRISHLRAGKIDLFTIDALVNMLSRAGVQVKLSATRSRGSTAA